MSVRSEMRHKRRNPCPVCGGGDDDPRGQERRCHGFTSDDGEYAHCSREELAGDLPMEDAGTYAHRLHGPCRCGSQHGEAKSEVSLKDDIAALYDYCDETGRVLYQVVRKTTPSGGKKFLQRRPDGAGDWVWSISGTRRVPYRLPELLKADRSRVVYIVEGEKDADTVAGLGEIATCNPMGASKWHFIADEAAKALRGRHVCIIADADDVGRAHALDVQRRLQGVAASIAIVEPPAPHKDVTDYVRAGLAFVDLVPAPPPPPAARFKILYAPELAKPLPPIDWLCEGYSLPRRCYCLIAGESYSGKSIWAMDLAVAVASGGSAVGLHKAKQGKVLWLDYDGQGEMITRTRAQRICRAKGYNLADLGDNFGYVNGVLCDALLDDEDALDSFSALFDGVAFAVVDSWRGVAPNTEEKDRAAVQRVGRTILRLIEKTGVTPMIVDHTTKPPRENKSTRSAIHDIHGSSAKAELAQWVMMFEKQEGKPVKVVHAKERMAAKTIAPFWLRYEDLEADGGLLVKHLDREQVTDADDPLAEAKVRILQVVSKSRTPLKSANAVFARTGGRRNVVMEGINELLDDGSLTQNNGVFRVERSGTR